MNIRDLEYLIALYDQGGFKKAAEHCKTSQPVISMAIQRIETKLGITLIERTTRMIRFTESGLSIVEQSRVIIGNIRTLKETAKTSPAKVNCINVGVIISLASHICEHLKPLPTHMKKTKLNIHEISKEKILKCLDESIIHCAISPCDTNSSKYDKIFLTDEPFVLAVHIDDTYIAAPYLEPSFLQEKKVMSIIDNSGIDLALCKYLSDNKIETHREITFSSLEMIAKNVSLKNGIAILPKISAKNAHYENVNCIPLDPKELKRSLYLIYKKNDPKRIHYITLAEFLKKILLSLIC